MCVITLFLVVSDDGVLSMVLGRGLRQPPRIGLLMDQSLDTNVPHARLYEP